MALIGNPTLSGRVTTADAIFISNIVSYAAGQPALLTDIATSEQLEASDATGNGSYGSDDGSLVRVYNTYLFNGGTLDLVSWREAGHPKYDDN